MIKTKVGIITINVACVAALALVPGIARAQTDMSSRVLYSINNLVSSTDNNNALTSATVLAGGYYTPGIAVDVTPSSCVLAGVICSKLTITGGGAVAAGYRFADGENGNLFATDKGRARYFGAISDYDAVYTYADNSCLALTFATEGYLDPFTDKVTRILPLTCYGVKATNAGAKNGICDSAFLPPQLRT